MEYPQLVIPNFAIYNVYQQMASPLISAFL